MRVHVIDWFLCGVFGLGLATLAAKTSLNAAPQAKADATRQAVEDLANGKADAVEISKKYELESVMRCFRLRTKGGFGVGEKEQGIIPDGIESKIHALTKKVLTPEELKREGPALIRMLQITRAIGEISAHYTEEARKDPKAWKRCAANMVNATKETEDAVKGNDPAKLRLSVSRLSRRCNECREK